MAGLLQAITSVFDSYRNAVYHRDLNAFIKLILRR